MVLTGASLFVPAVQSAKLMQSLNAIGFYAWIGPIGLGTALTFVGIVIIICDQIYLRRPQRHSKSIIAFRHHSLHATPAPPLAKASLPRELSGLELENMECDLTQFLAEGRLELPNACRIQDTAQRDLSARLKAANTPVFAYYGIAHIPFQVLLGRQLSQTNPTLYEFVKSSGQWMPLQTGKGPNLGVKVEKKDSPTPPKSLVVRVAVSYPVTPECVAQVIEGPFDDVLISLTKNEHEKISHYAQVEAIADAFRQALDKGRERLPHGAKIHVFFAGPMSVGFTMGRRISPTVHPEVIVYNYSAQNTPRYSWGLRVNASDGKSLVVRLRTV